MLPAWTEVTDNDENYPFLDIGGGDSIAVTE